MEQGKKHPRILIAATSSGSEFMYLNQTMEDMNRNSYPMVGYIEGAAYKTNRLNRFGYMTLISNENQLIAEREESIRGHEYHYFESTNCGDSFTGTKPLSETQWSCIQGNDHLAAGFPHLYYYSNMNMPYRFLKKCVERRASI